MCSIAAYRHRNQRDMVRSHAVLLQHLHPSVDCIHATTSARNKATQQHAPSLHDRSQPMHCLANPMNCTHRNNAAHACESHSYQLLRRPPALPPARTCSGSCIPAAHCARLSWRHLQPAGARLEINGTRPAEPATSETCSAPRVLLSLARLLPSALVAPCPPASLVCALHPRTTQVCNACWVASANGLADR